MTQQKAKFILVGLAGLLAGAALTVNLSAIADKDAATALPVAELRAFTDVFARIKSDYVEPVEDKKLITEAITGYVARRLVARDQLLATVSDPQPASRRPVVVGFVIGILFGAALVGLWLLTQPALR